MRKQQIILTQVLAGLLAVLASGCGGSSNSSGSSAVLNSNANVDFSNVNSMALASSGTTTASLDLFMDHVGAFFNMDAFADVLSAAAGLYTFNKDGSMTSVNLVSGGSGNFAKSVLTTSTYTILQTANVVDQNGNGCGLVLIAQNTGNTYCVGTAVDMTTDFFNKVQTDSTGDYVFFQNDEDQLIELNMTNPDAPDETVIASANVDGFAVNGNGDVLYDVDNGSTETNGTLYALPLGGTAQSLGTAEFGTLESLPGTSNFYVAISGQQDCTSGGVSIACNELVKSGSGSSATFAEADDSSLTLPMCLPGESCQSASSSSTVVLADAPASNLTWFFTTGGTVQMNSSGSCPGGQTCITWTGSATGMNQSGAEINSVQGGGGYVVIEGTNGSGQTGLYAYDISSKVMSTLLSPGSYSISSYSVDSSGNVSVSGTDSGGAIVIGTIAAGTTTFSISSSSLSNSVQQMAAVQ